MHRPEPSERKPSDTSSDTSSNTRSDGSSDPRVTRPAPTARVHHLDPAPSGTSLRSTARFRDLLVDREFRALWLAVGQSQFGDQLGRVALSILVFSTTGSGLVTAGVYALTYLPAMLGGVLLSGLADSRPRRELLVVSDLVRAALYLAMAIPGLPVLAVAALLTLAVTAGAPAKAAEPALVADMFADDQYSAALGLRTATAEVAQLLGFALGGLVVAAVGARTALAIDGVTFLVSALTLRAFLRHRPARAERKGRNGFGAHSVLAGLRLVFGDRRLRALMGFSWLAGCWVVPEGLAAPYATEHGGGAVAVGFLLATDAIGVLVGALVLTRLVAAHQRPLVLGPLAVASGVPLMICALDPGVPGAFALWTACGLLSSYQVLVVAEFVPLVAPGQRGQAIGIAASGLLAVQGIGVALGGVVAEGTGTAPAVALAGATGAVLAVLVTLSWGRARQAHRQAATSG